jgi:hypothetical protein
MPRIINLDGVKHTFPDDATDQEVAAALGGSAPPPPAPTHTSQALGFEQGVGNFLGNVADMAGKVPGVAPAFKALSGHDLTESTNMLRNPEHAPDVAPGKIGRFAGDMLESAPLAALAPAGIAGTVAAGAGTGALTADKGHQTEGALLGGGGGAVLHGIGKAIAPAIAPAVQALADRGVTMTPGQIFGGAVKGLEDRAAGIWPLDGWIKGAQRQSMRDFGTGAGNIAMGGLGPIPPGISGQAMAKTAHNLFDDAYGQVLPQLNVTLDGQFANTVNNAGDTVASRLPAGFDDQFNGTLADVFKKMGSGSSGPNNTFPGRAAKDAYSDLGTQARAYQGPNEDANNRALGSAYGQVQEGLRNAFSNSDPWAAGVLGNIDTAYKNFIPVDKAVERATGNGAGMEAGVFSPQQLRQAVTGQDSSVRHMAVSEGGGPMQQYAENGIQVLPSSIGSSGTAERLGLFALPAAAAAAATHPWLAAGAAAVPAIYSKPGLSLVNKMYAHGAGPTQTVIGNIMQQLARYGAGPTAGALTGGSR